MIVMVGGCRPGALFLKHQQTPKCAACCVYNGWSNHISGACESCGIGVSVWRSRSSLARAARHGRQKMVWFRGLQSATVKNKNPQNRALFWHMFAESCQESISQGLCTLTVLLTDSSHHLSTWFTIRPPIITIIIIIIILYNTPTHILWTII